MTEVNPSLLKEVQTTLAKYIKKPPLTDKLLKKPPFRYLHDLITSIIRETGFLNGLYSEKELDSNNVKEKDAKLKFLDKLISAVKTVTGTNLTVRSTKIVAGLEVDKTLELLLVIGKALDDKVDSSTAIIGSKQESRKTKQNDTKEKNLVKPPSKRKESESSKNSDLNNSTKDSVSVTSSKTVPKPEFNNHVQENQDNENKSKSNGEIAKKEAPNIKNSTRKSSISSRNETSSSKRGSTQSKLPSRKPSIDKSNRVINSTKNNQPLIKEETNEILKQEDVEEKEAKKPGILKDKNTSNDTIVADNQQMSKSESEIKAVKNKEYESDEINVNSNNKEDSPSNKKETTIIQRPGSARPGSRRSSHSKLLSNGPENSTSKESTSEKKPEDSKNETPIPNRPRTATRPPSARPGAPRIRDRGEVSVVNETKTPPTSVNVIEEGTPDQSDDKDSFIVIEPESSLPMKLDESSPINDQEQGKLVNQILRTQKELNSGVAIDSSQNKQSDIEWDAGRQRERDIVSREISKIRGSIQTLTSAANPLGRLFDFLQEDVDEMQRELQHWKKINENLQKQQISETELRKIFLQPLQKQLEDVDANIQEEFIQIGIIKNMILLNDEKIIKLITGSRNRAK